MEFDIVVATRNRINALQVSLPLMLGQDILPKKIIIVDSSENHGDVKAAVKDIFAKKKINLETLIIKSDAGASYQRNMGLKYVSSPIVMFPDDDVLWFPEYAKNIINIYEKDKQKRVGAVTGLESLQPPENVIEDLSSKPYEMMFIEKISKSKIGKIDNLLQRIFYPDPLLAKYEIIEKELASNKKKQIFGTKDESAFLTGTMKGCGMSFRSELIKELRFNELLGRYSLFEDCDASFGILKDYFIVCAGRAKYFHFRSPEKRVDEYNWGMLHVLNRSYVICKHFPKNSIMRKMLRRYLILKTIRFIFRAQTTSGRQRFIGAWNALMLAPEIINASMHNATTKYIELKNRCLALRKA